MKVLLVSVNREKAPYPVAPLGLAYIAASLSEDGHDVEVIDLCFEQSPVLAVTKKLSDSSPDIVAISIRNVDNLTYPKSVSYLPDIKEVVDAVKEESGLPVLLGGSGFSLFPEDMMAYLGADYGIVGEGESATSALLDALDSGDLSKVPNLIYAGGSITKNCRVISDAFSSTRPERSFIDNKRYFEAGGMANLQTKRGCPLKCVYCTYPALEGSSVRLRDPAGVVDELDGLYKEFGIDHIFFVDDIFNIPGEHAMGICDEISRRGIVINWTCFASPGSMNLELAQAMKRAGCSGVEFGTDGGVDATLKALGKGFRQSDVERAQRLCDDAGLDVAHYLLLGGPGETPKTLDATFDFMERLKPRAVIAMLGVRIYPFTPLYDLAVDEGLISDGESLLEPKFYISRDVEEILLKRVEEYALSRQNWIVPGLEIRSSEELSSTLRNFGKKGVLWNLLGN